MLLPGQWLLCDDGVLRPIFRGKMTAFDGYLLAVEFLADSGADRTVLSSATLERLGLPSVVAENQLGGVGGAATTVLLSTAIHFPRDDGSDLVFRGQFAAFTAPEALDMSVLGRDITNLFTLIIDRPRDLVCLLGSGHQYAITPIPRTAS
jgi:Aspartyl protease